MTLASRWLVDKQEVIARGAVVATKDPLAGEAGIEMLRAGGNAFDAAVAIGFAISVVEPMMTSIGGVGLMLTHEAASGSDWAIEYGPRAPRAATADMFEVLGPSDNSVALYKVRGDANETGYLSATVPATVAGLCLAHERFGSLPLAQVLEPAIHYAEQGYPINWFLALHIGQAAADLSRFPSSAQVFLPDGFPVHFYPEPAKVVQRDLGETLRRVAKDGRAGFYEGEIAHAIEDDMRSNGGLITAADLSRYHAVVSDPLRSTYRGWEVLFPTAPCGAWTAVETLNLLENFDISAAGHNSVDGLHLFIEAARLAFADRYFYLGDPDVNPVPLDGLLSKAYAQQLAEGISRERARSISTEMDPWQEYASKPINDPWPFSSLTSPGTQAAPSGMGSGDCTTHFCVMDSTGNAVTCTQTAVGYFGSKVISPGVGALYNNGMSWFNPVPGAINSIAGGKRPLTNMSPLMLKRDGRPVLLLGAQGGRKIINCNTQLVLNVVDHGLGIQAAIAAPRIDASGRAVLFDSRIDPGIAAGLERRGHQLRLTHESPAATPFAASVGILRDRDGLMHGGADVYRISEARGLD
jgi:gamma-glutamyltranspeptidase / glutathione hydrolase